MIKGIDVSAYQVNIPWAELRKHGLEFAIIKGDQMTATDNHFALARAAGVPVIGVYFWDDPIISAQVQIDYFSNEVRKNDPDFLAMDVEQWWAVWGPTPAGKTPNGYFDALPPLNRIKLADVPRKSPQAISDHAWAVANGLQKLFPKKKMFIYSGTWFTNGYALPMLGWLSQFPLWWAHYFDGALGDRQVTWDQLAATPPQPFAVWMPTSTLKWSIWQYSSTMRTPAQNARYDWNAYPGTLDDLKALCGLTPVIPPVVPPVVTPEPLTTDQRLTRLEKAVFPGEFNS